MVDEGLLAGDTTLWPAHHCPTFLPVTSRKCFVMLSTAQNRCGVFAGIETLLTGSQIKSQGTHRWANFSI
jgi:hypothetical protein